MTSIIREIKKRSTDSTPSTLMQTDSKAQSLMTVRVNGHTLSGVETDAGWTWTCESLPEFMAAIKGSATPVSMEQAMNLFFRFTNAVSFISEPITRKKRGTK